MFLCVCYRNKKYSAGQRSAPPPTVMALISLEDLDGLDDEQLDDDITDNPEPMDGDDRLLTHWQAVASTHQVSVPPGEGRGWGGQYPGQLLSIECFFISCSSDLFFYIFDDVVVR